MRRLPRIAALVLALLTPVLAFADPPRRTLNVSLYPYIPEAAAAALSLKQGFERDHPDVIVAITLNSNYYSLDPKDKGVLYEDADVHEIDVVFLGDFVERHKLAPLSSEFTASLDKLTPIAKEAATFGGRLVAVPQWMCADFLIYRADQAGLAGPHTLDQMERTLGPGHGLLMNLSGVDSLGELYLSALLARYGTPDTALDHVAGKPDAEIEGRFRRMLALEPVGLGRDPDYAKREDFYARQFARRAGGAFVGYSELIHDVLDESASCRKENRCVTASEIRVAPLPLQDGVVRPMVWVDLFGIDAHVHGQARADAEDFVRYAVSLPAYRALLIPPAGAPPRYLLPATDAAFSDPAIRAAAPLYRDFQAIVSQGAPTKAPHLATRLHDVAATLDADLPQQH